MRYRSRRASIDVKLRRVRIVNYRSIADQTIDLGDYSLLVGSNNSGKSNILDALRTVFDDGFRFDDKRDFPKWQRRGEASEPEAESWVEITFELTEQEIQRIKEHHNDYLIPPNCVRVRKWLYPRDRLKRGLVCLKGDEVSDVKLDSLLGVDQGSMLHVVYIPAVSRVEDHTKLTGPSTLRELLNAILTPVINSSQAYQALKEAVLQFSREIKAQRPIRNVHSLSDIERSINDEIASWGIQFGLEVVPPAPEDIVKNLIRHSLSDTTLNAEMDSERFGHGFQRYLVFSLIRVAATCMKSAPIAESGSGARLDLLLFEEPEAYLHPPLQSVLDTSLRQFAADPSKQVIAATHSPEFVSYNTDDLCDLVRVRRRQDGSSEIAQISKQELDIICDNQRLAEILNRDAAEPELEAARFFLWLNPDRSRLFFANSVLIVEGLSEQVLINYLVKTGQIETGNRGVFILEASGKYNIHRFMRLLGALHIDHAVLHDKDQNTTGESKKQQGELNRLIEESKNEYTKAVQTLPENLEALLGIEAKLDRWNKASQLLLAVQQRRVESRNLERFRRKVSKLLRSLAT